MSGIFCPLTILESNVLSRNITFYWRKTCRQLNRRKKKKKQKGAETVCVSSTAALKSFWLSRLFSVSHDPCFHHHRPTLRASYITTAPTSPCCDWLMTWQCSQTAAETQTTMFPPQSRKTQGSSQSIQIPAAFRGAMNISQWEGREISLFTEIQWIMPKRNITSTWTVAKSQNVSEPQIKL